MNIATAYVEVRTDKTKLSRDLDAVETDVKTKAASTAKVFAQIFSAAAFGAVVKGSIDAASDLNETVSKTKQLFGANADAVIAFSKTTAQSMGLSERAYLDAASGLKGLLDNLGLAPQQATEWSQKLTQLGSDLGSFFNKDPAEAVAAIGSAMRGESEPIRAFNVQINDAAIKQKALEMGLYDGAGAIDTNAKAQATLALIMAQTTAAQGDFARTADGAANSQRIAKATAEDSAASLGQAFLPIYTKVVQIVTALAKGFGELPAPVQVVIVALVGLAALAGPIGGMVNMLKSVTSAIKNLGVTGTSASIALGALGLVIIAATAWYQANADKKAHLKQVTDEFVAALEAEKKGQEGAVQAAVAKSLSDQKLIDAAKTLGLTTQDLADIVNGKQVPAYSNLQKVAKEYGFTQGSIVNVSKTLGVSTDSLNGKLEAMGNAFGLVNGTLAPLNDGLDNAKSQMTTSAQVAAELGTATDGVGTAAAGATPPVQDLGAGLLEAATNADLTRAAEDRAAAATKANEAATDALKSSLDDTSTSFSDAADAASALKAALDQVFGGSQSMEEANRNLQAEVDATTQSLKDNGKTLDIGTEKGRANREQIEKQANAVVDYGVALVGSGKSNEEATAAINFGIQALKDQLTAAGLTKEQVDEYINTLGLTPENVTTAIELADDEAAKAKLGDLLTQLGTISEGAAAEIQALIDQGKYDEAQAKIEAIAKARSITLNLEPGSGLKLTFGPGQTPLVRFGYAAAGAFVPRSPGGTPWVLGEGGSDEAVLPLGNRSRLAALLSDPRIGGPVSAAMGGSAGSGAQGGAGGLLPPIAVYNNGREFTVDDMSRAIQLARLS